MLYLHVLVTLCSYDTVVQQILLKPLITPDIVLW